MMDECQTAETLAEAEALNPPVSPLRLDAAVEEQPGRGWQYYNRRMAAPNVWEVDVDLSLVNEAARMYAEAGLREAHVELAGRRGVPIRSYSGGGSSFAVVQPKGWSSDVNWFTVDDEATMERFTSIFTRLGLASLFAPVVGHNTQLAMYSAMFVVRSQCTSANVHTDWADSVGTSALTLITPLGPCKPDANGGFHLLYESEAPSSQGRSERTKAEAMAALRQYSYVPGKAIVFGAGFRHSTEPGCAACRTEPQAFLCLTFGTDRLDMWPAIAHKGLRDQSRVLSRPDGSIERTGLGEQVADHSFSMIQLAMMASQAR